jgi:hypothetical protein
VVISRRTTPKSPVPSPIRPSRLRTVPRAASGTRGSLPPPGRRSSRSILVSLTLLLGPLGLAAAHRSGESPPETLRPALAFGLAIDTLVLGGYAAGSFVDAIHALDGDLTAEERALLGQHLGRIFSAVLPEESLGRSGRLRVVLERTVRPEGRTRGIRVLAAEVAAGGRIHGAFRFEHRSRPEYYDLFGRSLQPDAWSGPLVDLRMTSGFAERRLHPTLDRVLPHNGVDFAAAPGDAVRATRHGVVVVAATHGGYGLLVELRHPDGYTTRYAHLRDLAPGLAPGHEVRQGELLGHVGMSGRATGPHLHYEVHRGGRAIDPLGPSGPGFASFSGVDEVRWTIERRALHALLRQRSRGQDDAPWSAWVAGSELPVLGPVDRLCGPSRVATHPQDRPMSSSASGTPDPPLAAFYPQAGTADDARIEVRTPVARIGQAPQNEILLDDDTVSSRHARLEYLEGGWRITDLESKNGTYVDGIRLAPGVPTPLPEEAVVAFGAVKLGFRTFEDADAAAAAAAYVPDLDTPAPPRRAGFRLPLWLLLLLLLSIALLVFLFLTFRGGPAPMEPITEPPVTALLVLAHGWIST